MAKTSKKAKRTPNAAFMKPVTPDEKLAKIVGDKPLPRTELTKKLWAYIRKNGLQDAKKKTLINADENLKAVFNGKKQVSMFEMTIAEASRQDGLTNMNDLQNLTAGELRKILSIKEEIEELQRELESLAND